MIRIHVSYSCFHKVNTAQNCVKFNIYKLLKGFRQGICQFAETFYKPLQVLRISYAGKPFSK